MTHTTRSPAFTPGPWSVYHNVRTNTDYVGIGPNDDGEVVGREHREADRVSVALDEPGRCEGCGEGGSPGPGDMELM